MKKLMIVAVCVVTSCGIITAEDGALKGGLLGGGLGALVGGAAGGGKGAGIGFGVGAVTGIIAGSAADSSKNEYRSSRSNRTRKSCRNCKQQDIQEVVIVREEVQPKRIERKVENQDSLKALKSENENLKRRIEALESQQAPASTPQSTAHAAH